ncbi:MAG: hypothetical protein JXR91_02305 [Deltaproteobacteria bacterium]|nr:hypothetical protein [Deltaproteobacteria bacterium]
MKHSLLSTREVLACLTLAMFFSGGITGCDDSKSNNDGASKTPVDPTPDIFAPDGTEPPEDFIDVKGGTATGCEALGERIRISSVTLDSPAVGSDEYHPLVISPFGDNSSLISWKDQVQDKIHVATLDSDDSNPKTILSINGQEVHAIAGHKDGGAIAFMDDDPDIYSPKYCKSDATPDNARCGKLDLLRFDDKGKTLFRTTLTEKKNVDSEGALFIWWYQHTARIVWSGEVYGVYFRTAGSSPRPNVEGEIDIHAGDTLRFIDPLGNRVEDGWDWGCSHSWSVRLAYNGNFAAACHGDAYPNALRVKILDGGDNPAVLLHDGTPPDKRALGGLVADEGGFWLSYLQTTDETLELHLARITDSGEMERDDIIKEAVNIDAEYIFRPYLSRFGDDLLIGWKSNEKLNLAVANNTNGAIIEGPITTEAPIDQFVDMVAYPNGDAAWANSEGGSKITVTRVLSCQK